MISRLAAFFRLALLLALLGTYGLGSAVFARAPSPGDSPATVALADLPAQARQTLSLIERGGPFPFPGKDGSIFGNFEKRLPVEKRGYYREYTVPTPGRHDRGARRIVAGGDTTSGEYYYSDDHYRTFRKIRRP